MAVWRVDLNWHVFRVPVGADCIAGARDVMNMPQMHRYVGSSVASTPETGFPSSVTNTEMLQH